MKWKGVVENGGGEDEEEVEEVERVEGVGS